MSRVVLAVAGVAQAGLLWVAVTRFPDAVAGLCRLGRPAATTGATACVGRSLGEEPRSGVSGARLARLGSDLDGRDLFLVSAELSDDDVVERKTA